MSKKAKMIYQILAILAVVEIIALAVLPHVFGNSQDKQPSVKLSQSQAKTAGTKADDLMKNLYQRSNDEEYANNKQNIIKNDVMNTKVINKVMPGDDSQSQINSTKLQSTYEGSQAFQKGNKAGDMTIEVKSTVTKSGESTKSTIVDAYQAHYDPKSKRFTKLIYQGQQKTT
ncbi:unnamed protein product [Fructobacillus cardui]|uniref:hypothetical protein n=1 Tax=Fructobacillus cardui TaxID=2893170 RepID=UPI002D9E317A|nr:unnamed protein product [Fructobacillus cardui]